MSHTHTHTGAVTFTNKRMIDFHHPWQVLKSMCGCKFEQDLSALDSKYSIGTCVCEWFVFLYAI
jgi:hypothetical protein